MPSLVFDQYLQLVDNLREMRRSLGVRPVEERDLLNQLEDLWEKLPEDDQETAQGMGWRSWPDLYDLHQSRPVG